MNNRQLITLALREASNGRIVAYASVFDVVSQSGIIIRKGAFAQSLDTLKTNGYLLYNHDRDGLPMGIIESAQEDDYGLLVTAQFHSHPQAQALRQIVEERIAAGVEVSMSIAFYVDGYEQDSEGHVIVTQAQIVECSIVLFPDNPEARVITVQERKPLREQIRDAISAIEAATFEASYTANRIKALARLRKQENRDISDETKSTIETLSQHVERLQAALASIAQDLDASIHPNKQKAFDIEEFVKLFEYELT
jgi:HK97 family phage prohead protease